jgi:hypothetical protein
MPMAQAMALRIIFLKQLPPITITVTVAQQAKFLTYSIAVDRFWTDPA